MNSNPFMVNFLIMGAQKSGTSALSFFLSRHPEICMPPAKEAHFFDSDNYDDSRSFEEVNREYQKYFPNYSGQKIVGEATPIYMYLPHIVERIHGYNPKMKLIFILRNPIERAVSHYNMAIRSKKEFLPFWSAILIEKIRLWRHRNNFDLNSSSLRFHSYIDRGFYSRQIERAKEYFPLNNMIFIRTEDLWHSHAATLVRIYDFLGVKDRTMVPKQEKIFSHDKEYKASSGMIKYLRTIFLPEFNRLEALLNWDLTEWKI